MTRTTVHAVIIFASLTLSSLCATAQTNELLINSARKTFNTTVGIEFIGLFWIGCELAILFCLGVALRNLLAKPIPETLLLTRRDKRVALGYLIFFAILSVAILTRHLFIVPLPDAIRTIMESDSGEGVSEIKSAYIFRARTHLFIWFLFITGWAALEIAIVAKGVRAYRTLRQIFSEHQGA